MLIVGIDVGLSFTTPSTGVAKVTGRRCVVDHTTADALSRERALELRPERGPVIDVLAVDGPVLRTGEIHDGVRSCEKLLVWGAFHGRCKPGETQVAGTGRALRRGGCDTARQLAPHVSGSDVGAPFPRVQVGHNIVEAFPNAFLAVLLPDDAFEPVIRRGERSDVLFETCRARGVFRRLERHLGGGASALWQLVEAGGLENRDERAAVVCAMTALGVLRGKYVAVGEPAGGYVFLPPSALWAGWARAALDLNRRDRRMGVPVDLWVDGTRMRPGEPLR